MAYPPIGLFHPTQNACLKRSSGPERVVVCPSKIMRPIAVILAHMNLASDMYWIAGCYAYHLFPEKKNAERKSCAVHGRRTSIKQTLYESLVSGSSHGQVQSFRKGGCSAGMLEMHSLRGWYHLPKRTRSPKGLTRILSRRRRRGPAMRSSVLSSTSSTTVASNRSL
jgi:hypothetical protein